MTSYNDEIELEIDFGDSGAGNKNEEVELEIDFGGNDTKKDSGVKDDVFVIGAKGTSGDQKKGASPSSFSLFKRDPIDMKFKDYKVVFPYVAKLQIKDVSMSNTKDLKNRFYTIKILYKENPNEIGFFAKWGRIGMESDYLYDKAESREEAEKMFRKKFLEKTFNNWDDRDNFNPVVGGYTMLGVANYDNEEEEIEKSGGRRRNLQEKQFMEKLELVDKKIMTEISSLGYEKAMVMRDLFSVTRMSDIMSDIGIDKLRLGLENLTMRNITGAHQVLAELQNELTSKGKRFNTIFGLSEKFDKFVPMLRRKSSVNLIDNLDKIRTRFTVVEHLRDIITPVKLYKAIQMKSGAEKNPIDLIYNRLGFEISKVEKESKEHDLVLQMMGTHGEIHQNFELELRDIFSVKGDEIEVDFYPFRKLDRKLLWLGGRESKMANILK